jgi:hypothetical protein
MKPGFFAALSFPQHLLSFGASSFGEVKREDFQSWQYLRRNWMALSTVMSPFPLDVGKSLGWQDPYRKTIMFILLKNCFQETGCCDVYTLRT